MHVPRKGVVNVCLLMHSCRKSTTVTIASKPRLCSTAPSLSLKPPSPMALLMPPHIHHMNTIKRVRRTATTVMAGSFDVRPPRDVLTSLLNGVPRYAAVEGDEEKKKSKRERRERRRLRAEVKARKRELMGEAGQNATIDGLVASTSSISITLPAKSASKSSFWRARPTIHIATMQRSVSVTPPPVSSPRLPPSTPGSTPGPSMSSSTSRTSSKRPRTPDDDEDLESQSANMADQPQRKKRIAAKKGWKGWVAGSPEPSEKLINLDAVPVLQERRTRSGKNFDAIGLGKEGWV